MSRTRTRSMGSATCSYAYHRSVKSRSGSNSETDIVGTALGPLVTETCVDEVTPRFKARSASGEIIINPWTMTTQYTYESIGQWHYAYPDSMYPTLGTYEDGTLGTRAFINMSYPVLTLPVLSTGQYKSEALTNARAGVSKSDASLFTTIGEIKETMGMLRSMFTRLDLFLGRNESKISSCAKFFDVRSVQEIPDKGLRNAYLELRYGWRPFVYEVRSILKAFEDKQVNSRQTSRGFSYKVDELEGSLTTSQPRCPCTLKYRKKREYTARAGVLYVIDPNYANSLFHKLGLDKPLEAAWDLLPFSFVVDWFVNIGTQVAAWSPDIGVHSLGTWVTTLQEEEYDLIVTGMSPPAGRTIVGGPFRYKTTLKIKGREKSSYAPSVVFSPRLDLMKSLDLVAIGSSLISSRFAKLPTGRRY